MTRTRETLWRTRTLAAGLLVIAMMVAGMMAASTAYASTTYTVNIADDFADASAGDARCDVTSFLPGDQCSLRAAIEQANTTPGADAINFGIPGTGAKTIHVGANGHGPLPTVTGQATINGYTQPGASPNTKAVGDDAKLKIVLEGSNAGSFGDGLRLDGASHSVIKGLVINRFDGAAINIFGNSVATSVQGNFLGTDVTGTLDKGNGSNGVSAFSDDISNTLVGGTHPAARNVVGGNGGTGVGMGDGSNEDSPSDNVRVQGNYIGVDRSGTQEVGNDASGIFLNHVSSATIGGTTAASRNVIGGNNGGLDFSSVSNSRVLGNRIGTSANGTGALGNNLYGVFLQGFGDAASFNSLGDGTVEGSNTIAFNNGDGIRQIDPGIGNRVSRNSIFSNFESGIDLLSEGQTANDGDNPSTPEADPDSDTGPNELQNSPVLSSARNNDTTAVAGSLNSTPGKTFKIQFFSNPSGDEGKTFIGQKSVTTDAGGNVSFTFQAPTRVAPGQSVTATATNPTGSTSEFSAPRAVTDTTAPNVENVSPTPNATGVAPSANASAIFSEAMSASSINATTFTLKESGTTRKVDATVSYSATTKKATFNPTANLKSGATYVATVTTGAKDEAGNALDQSNGTTGNQPKSWRFTVRK
jgi:CSLREA domain-containing protein